MLANAGEKTPAYWLVNRMGVEIGIGALRHHMNAFAGDHLTDATRIFAGGA